MSTKEPVIFAILPAEDSDRNNFLNRPNLRCCFYDDLESALKDWNALGNDDEGELIVLHELHRLVVPPFYKFKKIHDQKTVASAVLDKYVLNGFDINEDK